ncbi:hypothetical protein J7643_11960 [bacterium]|nr:hypothetical protein [bacterium]
MKKTYALTALGAILLAGCAGPLVGTTGAGDASLSVVTAVQDGQFRTQAPGLSPYTKSNINHLVLKLYTLDGSNESPVMRGGVELKAEVGAEVLDEPVTFKNLHPDTTYRIRAFAYKATGEATDDLISTTDTGSYRDVSVGRSLAPSIVSLPVKLINRLFKAEATSSIVVTDGDLVNEDEAITVPVPTSFNLAIAGVWDNFTVNGDPSSVDTYRYTPSVSTATALLTIANNGSETFFARDLNNSDNATNWVLIPVGATGSLMVQAQNGTLNVVIETPRG